MAPLPVIADTYRVTLNWSGSGVTAANVLHVETTTLSVANIYATMNTNVTSSMWDVIRSTMAVDTVEIIPLDGSSPTQVFSTGRPAKWTGVQASGDFITSTAALVSFRTLQRGPRGRGRLYLPYPGESAVTNGFINGGNVTTMQNAWNTFHTNIATAGLDLCVASYTHADKNTVTSIVIEAPVATQRRRQDRLR